MAAPQTAISTLDKRGDRVQGKIAIVTGAGSSAEGIGNGKAAALLLARHGAKVGLVDFHESAAAETARMIEDEGGEGLVIQADVTDVEQMRELMKVGHEQWGPIHGVIHAAGIAGGGLLQLKTRQMAEQVLGPKVRGALVLQEVLADQPLEFFFLFSSLFAVAGGIGQVDYSAANNFLDAFARHEESGAAAK